MAFSLLVEPRDGARVRFVFFLSSLLFSTALLAQPWCFDWIRSDANAFNHQQVYQNDHYEFIKTVRGSHGGKRVLLKLRDGKTWMIPQRSYFDNSIGGNPLWFLSVMPIEISEHFGFKIYDQHLKPFKSSSGPRPIYIEIPDVHEINGALEKLDALLISKGLDGIPFRFIVDEGKTGNETFLKNLVFKNGLPFSLDNKISFHDLNYHFMTFFLVTKKMFQQSQLTTEVYLKFADWLKEKHPEAATQSVVNEIYAIRANAIDRLGNLTVHMQDPWDKSYYRAAREGVNDFVGGSGTPFEFFKDSMKHSISQSTVLLLFNFSYVEEFKKTLDTPYFTSSLEVGKILNDPENEVPDLRFRLLDMRKVLRGK